MMRTSLFDPLSRMFLMSFLVICILQPSLGDDDMEVDDEPDEVGTINGEMVPEHWPDPIIQNTGDPDADGKAEMVCLIGNYGVIFLSRCSFHILGSNGFRQGR